jgi:hypothetical protein
MGKILNSTKKKRKDRFIIEMKAKSRKGGKASMGGLGAVTCSTGQTEWQRYGSVHQFQAK